MTDEFVTERLYGNYRAKVVDNKDKEKFGRIRVWIPDLMPQISDSQGMWARPANNPIGGRNRQEGTDENHYMGSSYIPRKGAWVWIFFEAGNINRPYYFGALDLENTPVLPENQVGTNYEDKWTIFKSNEGRVIVISDDVDDERIEITGKKRRLTNPPTGDTGSVYQIHGNMTTILLDERTGKQKLLVRTYQGDFIHVDIDERQLQMYFQSDIQVKTHGDLYLTAKNIHVKTEEEVRVTSKEDMHIKSELGRMFIEAQGELPGETPSETDAGRINVVAKEDIRVTAEGNISQKAEEDHLVEAIGNVHTVATCDINADAGGTKYEQSGTSDSALDAEDAEDAEEAQPEGERHT